jgi:hypothetical protein
MNRLALLVLLLTTTVAAKAQTKNVLYKVEKEGYKTSYLFGTVHMIPADKLAFTDGFINALNNSELLVLEADISEENLSYDLLKSARLPNNGTLDTAMTAADYALLDSALIAASGMGMKAYKYFKPFFLEAALLMSIAPPQFEIVEKVLLDLVSTDTTKQVFYLETVAQQMCTFDSIPVREQLAFTLEYVREPAKMKADYDSLIALYLQADVAQLYQLSIEPFEGSRYDYYLLEKRNRNWAPQLIERMATQKTFVAVGAGHLGGSVGLITLLEQAGFTVTFIGY